MFNVNLIFLFSLLIITIGYLIKKLGIITEKDGKIIAKLILNVTLPALIISVIYKIEIELTLILLPFLSILYSFFVLSISFFLFKKYPRDIKGLLMMTVLGFNIGLFAYPMIEMIWGEKGLLYVIMFDIGNSFIIFGLVYTIGLTFSPKENFGHDQVQFRSIFLHLIKSVPLISWIIALVLNISNIVFPIFVIDLLEILSRANMVLTLLLLGIFLNFKIQKSYWRYIIQVLVIRYSLGLTVGVILYFLLPFDPFYKVAIMIALILPLGMSAVAFSSEFGYREELTTMIVNLTTIISFILMWLIVLIFEIA